MSCFTVQEIPYRKQKDFPNFLELSAEPVHQVFLGFVKPIFDHRQFLALVQRT